MKVQRMTSIEEEQHLKQVVSSLITQGQHYLACQVSHLAGILKSGSQRFLPILRWGYLVSRGFLTEPEAVALLMSLYSEAHRLACGGSRARLLRLLARSRDARWLAARLRDQILRQQENRKRNLDHRGEIHEQVYETELYCQEATTLGPDKPGEFHHTDHPGR